MQLLCKHDRAAGALQLLGVMLDSPAGGTLSPGHAEKTVQAAAVAVSKSGTQSQQERLVQLLSGSKTAQRLARAAVSSMLADGAAPAPAVALLLHTLQQQDNSQSGLLAQMQPVAEQLCKLVCASSSNSTRSKEPTHPLLCLPSPLALAEECASGSALLLSAHLTAQLINSVAGAHPELQPTPAAAALGVLDPLYDHAPAAQSPPRHGSAPDPDALDLSSATRVVARLCLQQQQQQSDGDASRLHDWVHTLTPEAAGAALFAVWHWAQEEAAPAPQAGSAAVPASVSAVCLELYLRSKLSGDSLVFDFGLMAAAEAAATTGDWAKGMCCGGATVHDAGAGTLFGGDGYFDSFVIYTFTDNLHSGSTTLLQGLQLHTSAYHAFAHVLLCWCCCRE
jgi:hypothetical protein